MNRSEKETIKNMQHNLIKLLMAKQQGNCTEIGNAIMLRHFKLHVVKMKLNIMLFCSKIFILVYTSSLLSIAIVKIPGKQSLKKI